MSTGGGGRGGEVEGGGEEETSSSEAALTISCFVEKWDKKEAVNYEF